MTVVSPLFLIASFPRSSFSISLSVSLRHGSCNEPLLESADSSERLRRFSLVTRMDLIRARLAQACRARAVRTAGRCSTCQGPLKELCTRARGSLQAQLSTVSLSIDGCYMEASFPWPHRPDEWCQDRDLCCPGCSGNEAVGGRRHCYLTAKCLDPWAELGAGTSPAGL